MSSGLLLNAYLKTRDALTGRAFTRNRDLLETSQWKSRDEVLAFQWKELEKLLDIAFKQIPFYQRKYAEAGAQRSDIRTIADFRKLPILSRDELVKNLADLSPQKPLGTQLHLHATGGSTGTPVRFYRSLESFDWRSACTKRAYGWSGLRLGDPTLHLWGSPAGKVPTKNQLKMKLDQLLRNELIIPTFSQNEELWRHVYAEWNRYRPTHIIGYVSSLARFARFIDSAGLPPLHQVQGILAAAEPLEPNIRNYVESVLKAPVFNTYGSREFMSIGAECEKRNGMHVHVENLVVETAKEPQDGPSEILITDLHNLGTIFIRYAIGDLGIVSDRRCDCGRGLPLLDSVQGRTFDVLRFADGRTVPGIYFRHILKEIPEILEYQVRQDSLEKITILAVVSRPISEKSRAFLDDELRKVLGSTQIAVEPVTEILKTRSGKNKTVVGLEESSPA